MVHARGMKRPLVALAFLFVVACNNPSGVGSPCTVNTDCDLGQYCDTTAPGGFCTHGCSFGGAKLNECPSGSVCTSIRVGTQVCAATCSEAATCRAQYECAAVDGAVTKACKPKS